MFSVHPAGSNAELWVVNADGTGLLNLTNSPYQEEALNAAWSPDGTKIAFSRTGDSQECAAAPDACGWWIINTDGNGLIRLIPDGGDGFQGSTPQWSPDGSRLVFTGWVPDGNPGDPYFDLFVVNSDGSGLVQLTIGEDRYAFPTWSPDGNQIAYTTCCSGDYSHLYIMAPDGTGQQQLTDDALGWDAGAPVWSPDGSKILFSCTGMCLISPDGSGLVNFTELYAGPTVSNLPAWSPDGSVIGFSSDVGTGYDVFTIRPDGTGLRNLTNSPLDDSFGSWGP
jgi:Tol biopolymer transport system component